MTKLIFIIPFYLYTFALAHEVRIGNPAAQYCLERAGVLIPKKDAKGGEYALCRLPSGKVCEEWAFYRGTCR